MSSFLGKPSSQTASQDDAEHSHRLRSMWQEFQNAFIECDPSNLTKIANKARAKALSLANKTKTSHIGSVLSCIDILTLLYHLKEKQESTSESSQFEIILSKGHAAMAVYSVLFTLGEISTDNIENYCADGQLLYGHVDHKAHSWIPLSTGSLGHGFPFGLGMAIAHGRTEPKKHVFVLISDGELNEGTTWESALIASALSLENITVLIDYNKIQSFGRVEEVLPIEPLEDKWKSFGWECRRVDGHDFSQMASAISNITNRTALILDTIKGKGVSFMEDRLEWHYKSPDNHELSKAIWELNSQMDEE